MSVADNLARIRQIIGHEPIRLIAVTKNVEPAKIEEAYRLGVTDFGENRVQDALNRRNRLDLPVSDKASWHFIGHLQTNKVKQVVGRFSLIHSIDSLRLAQAVSREATARGLVQPVLVQVKVAEDPGKFGFSIAELKAQFGALLELTGIKIEGLMTIAPFTSDRAIWRGCFSGLKELRDELERDYGVTLGELSMGMSQDWVEAVDCGATMVRLGRAIFG